MKKAPLLLVVGLMPVASLAALTPEPAVAPLEIGSMSVDLKPGLKIGIGNDSNVYTEVAARADSSLVYSLAPSLSMRVGDDLQFSEVLLAATGGWVDYDDADNYTDYSAAFVSKIAPAGNFEVNTRIGTAQGHDERGSGNSDRCTNGVIPLAGTLCPAEPNVFQDVTGNLSMMFGNSETRGRFTLGVDAMGRRYTNNGGNAVASATVAPQTDALEYDNLGFNMKLAVRAGGATSAVIEARTTDSDYLAGVTAVDSVEDEILGGVEWDVTGKTTGYLKGGISRKDFAAAGVGDLEEPAWRAGATWMPTERSLVNLEMGRRFRESTVAGTVVKDVTTWGFNAMHRINDRVEPYVRVSRDFTEYPGIQREDDSLRVTGGVDYKFRRWVVLGLSWAHSGETVESAPLIGGNSDYARDVIMLTADMTL